MSATKSYPPALPQLKRILTDRAAMYGGSIDDTLDAEARGERHELAWLACLGQAPTSP